MKEILLEAFRHHAWANKQLLAACRGLPHEQLTLPGTAAGTDRGILAVFNHIIQSDRGYVSRRGDRPDWAENEEDTADLDELDRRVDENAQVWERFLTQPLRHHLERLAGGQGRGRVAVADAMHGDWRQADVADEPGGHRRSSSIGSQMSKYVDSTRRAY